MERRGREARIWTAAAIVALAALALAEHLSLRHYRKLGALYWYGDPARRAVALTFDDGPNEPYTREILEVLRRHGARGTFFIVGRNALADPASVRAVRDGGHAIGNHSFSHADLLLEREGAVLGQIERTQAAIQAAAGICPAFFRPPFGLEDAVVLHAARKAGLAVVKWSVSSKDWTRPGVERIVDRVLRGVRPGAIVLMHDGNECHGGDRSESVVALERLIPRLRAEGYELVTVPELLGIAAVLPCGPLESARGGR